MEKPIVLIGGGGHCKSVIEAIESTEREILGVLDVQSNAGKEVLGYKVIGTDEDIVKYVNIAEFIIAVGQIKSPGTRLDIAQKVKNTGGIFATIIASTAYVSKYASIGCGTVVLHGAMINADAKVGKNCIINTMANIEHDAQVGDFCHISTGAMINGNARIGECTFIGSGAIIRESITIAENTVIGAGRVILDSI